MYKDPTEFRVRFKAYKEGKMPYENGLPKFAGGTPGLTSTQQAALDDMYNYFNPLGYDTISISGMGGNGLLESGLNPNIVSKSGYAGVWQNNKNLQNAIKDMYGDHSKDNLFRYANAWVNGDRLIRKGKHAAHTALGSGKFKKAGYKTAEEAADAWLKNYERAVILDSNGKVIGYQDQGKRKAFAKAAYNYLFGKYGKGLTAVVPEPIIEQAVSTAVRNTIPAEQTHARWEGAENVSPFITGKPMVKLRPRIQLPNLVELMEDFEWGPSIPGLKNGKLPRYKDGKPKGDGMKYSWDDLTQSWTRYTGDTMGDIFADFVVTPRGGAHKKDIEPVLIVTPEQQQYSQRNKPTVSTNSTWHYTPAASTFVGRAVLAAGGDWKSADIASAGVSLHPLLSVPLGIMDTGYNLNQSLHDLTDANKHVNTALSAASILPLVGGIKLLKGKDVGTKLLNAYNNYMYSLGNVDDINNTLRNIKYLDSAADATPAVKGVYQDYSFNGRNLFEEMQKRYAREELAGTFKPIDLHDIAKDAYVKDMGRMGILEGKKYDNYNSVVQSVLENSIYPRMQAMRQWIPQEKFLRMFNTIADGRWTMHPVDTFKKAFGKNTTVNGLYTPSTGNIAVRAGGGGDDISDILLHEIRHKIDDGIPLTEEETNILRAAYGDKFMEIPKVSPDWEDTGIGADYDMWPEAVTTNRDARSAALGPMERRMNVHQLNLVIDKLSDQQILEAVANANGYGRRFVDNLIGDGPLDASLVSKEQIKAWREAMKKIGMFSGAAYLMSNAIPEYKNGKSPIHIKPANRGKLTRLKARTGKSESELYNDGNPAHKKMVVFARNARKWKH